MRGAGLGGGAGGGEGCERGVNGLLLADVGEQGGFGLGAVGGAVDDGGAQGGNSGAGESGSANLVIGRSVAKSILLTTVIAVRPET